MNQSVLSRELALSIGLAARALPDIKPKQLINALVNSLKLPITEQKLKSLTLKSYQGALSKLLHKSYNLDLLRNSLAYLHSVEKTDLPEICRPPIKPYHDGDLPNSIRVAIVSEDGVHIDSAFTICEQVYIYQVSALKQQLIQIRVTDTPTAKKAIQKNHYRAELVQDCQVLYCSSIGGLAAAKVIKHGVHPLKVNSMAVITDILEQLQFVLLTSPPPWLAKAMGVVKDPLIHALEEKTL
ncbi:hypothetical protein AU255_14835 [Methyloprofundus sedimenti]|uniref:Dinitrogenase iron-molybdenum cofactor biosynthesis protein n=1 Tax=Methyloprofundus sedimenti TaxID=1420851 RepID=A0A1V8M1R0_9GAMM|nr:dinitrogenase iron-molybdenum cofactor N-terminal domain-containing protein [Methyloprofundus sedimenti]OQK15500.1 hypothetical protein AU255_14835 [Methyloprofundus sedimenti]